MGGDSASDRPYSDIPFVRWSAKDVAAWVTTLGSPVKEYASAILEHELSGDVLATYTKEEHLKPAIPKLGVQTKLLLAIQSVKAQDQWKAGSSDFKRQKTASNSGSQKQFPPPSGHTPSVARKMQEGGNQATYLIGRPRSSVGLPLALAHPLLGKLRDMIRDFEPGEREFQFVDELVSSLTNWCTDERERSLSALVLLGRFFAVGIANVKLPGSNYETNGFIGTMDGPEPIFQLCIEVANEVCSTQTLKDFQLAAYFKEFINFNSGRATVATSCHPTVFLQICGQFVRFSIAAYLDKPIVEPLTNFINVLPFDDTGCFVELAKAFGAVAWFLPKQVAYFAELSMGLDVPRLRHLTNGIPYPIAFPDLCPELRAVLPGRWEEPAHLFEARSRAMPLLRACYSEDGFNASVIAKFVKRYPEEIHRLLAEHELAPKLYGCAQLPGGWVVVIFEHLRNDEGWCVLGDVTYGSPTFEEGKEAAKEALKRVHNLPDRKIVLGDVRPPNIAYNFTTKKVKFLDLDWAAEEGTPQAIYPDRLNHQIKWAGGVKERARMLQVHDVQMISTLGRAALGYAWDRVPATKQRCDV